MNDWFQLLLAFREGKFPQYYYGLTPRFIVGACQIPIGRKFENSDLAYETTKQMFLEMQSYDFEGLIVATNQCTIHSGQVMQLVEAEWTKDSLGTNFDEIWARYGDEIISGMYSINAEELTTLKTIFVD